MQRIPGPVVVVILSLLTLNWTCRSVECADPPTAAELLKACERAMEPLP